MNDSHPINAHSGSEKLSRNGAFTVLILKMNLELKLHLVHYYKLDNNVLNTAEVITIIPFSLFNVMKKPNL